jgi:hypothetical protein
LQESTNPKQLRSFALLAGFVFAVLGLWPFIFRGQNIRQWAMILAALFAVSGIFWPACLHHVYRVWMAVGHALAWVNTRLLLGLSISSCSCQSS